MRKLMLILLLLFCSLHFAGGGEVLATEQSTPMGVQLSVDRSGSDVWLCERHCNSDLGLPRVPGQIATPQAIVAPPRGGNLAMEREALRSAALRREVNLLTEVAQPNLRTIFAGSRAVDHYIYRLRRLII